MAKDAQLKKNHFLAAVPAEPTTKGELVDILAEYEFLSSWLDYLIDHFEKQGRIIVERDEDGHVLTLQRKGKKGPAGPREAVKVVWDEEGSPSFEKRVLTGTEQLDKEAGEAATESAAVKRACSAVFQTYKEQTTAIKALLDSDGEEAEAKDK